MTLPKIGDFIALKIQRMNSPQSNRQTNVNTCPLAIQAAVAGLGVALGWQHLVDRYLESGSLLGRWVISM